MKEFVMIPNRWYALVSDAGDLFVGVFKEYVAKNNEEDKIFLFECLDDDGTCYEFPPQFINENIIDMRELRSDFIIKNSRYDIGRKATINDIENALRIKGVKGQELIDDMDKALDMMKEVIYGGNKNSNENQNEEKL